MNTLVELANRPLQNVRDWLLPRRFPVAEICLSSLRLEAVSGTDSGFDAESIQLHYAKEAELQRRKTPRGALRREVGGSTQEISKIEGLLLLKQEEAKKKQALLDKFDFRAQDKNRTKELVGEINKAIATLNGERYSLVGMRKK